MLQNLPVNGFNWVENESQFNDEESDEGYFIDTDVQYPKKLRYLHND